MLTETELKMLELIVAADGDIEKAKNAYADTVTERLIVEAGNTKDPDMLTIIADTVDRKVKQILPAIGTAFIKQGKLLGGKTRISTNKEN